MRGVLSSRKSVELALADLELHKAIVEGANNEILNDVYVGIQGRFIVVNYLIRPLKIVIMKEQYKTILKY